MICRISPVSYTHLDVYKRQPQKVSRPGGRDDAGQNSTQLKLNYESNFNHFIKLLNNSPDQVEDLMRLLMEKKELLVQAGMNKGTAEDIARFFSMIGLKEGNMSALSLIHISSGGYHL